MPIWPAPKAVAWWRPWLRKCRGRMPRCWLRRVIACGTSSIWSAPRCPAPPRTTRRSLPRRWSAACNWPARSAASRAGECWRRRGSRCCGTTRQPDFSELLYDDHHKWRTQMKLTNANLLITGANRGIGLAFAKAALARGANKVYAGARNPDSITLPGVIPLRLDVNSPADIAAAAQRAADTTLLINNAGIAITG